MAKAKKRCRMNMILRAVQLLIHGTLLAPCIVAQAPEVGLCSASFVGHDGVIVDPSCAPLVEGRTSGDFSIKLSLECSGATKEDVQHAWCYIVGGQVFNPGNGATYFAAEASELEQVPGSCIRTVPYCYRCGTTWSYPDVPAGTGHVLRVFVGPKGFATTGMSAPASPWGYVDVPFSVVDDAPIGYNVIVSDHRNLVVGWSVEVGFVRPVGVGVETVDVKVTRGDVALASSMAVFADGQTFATVPMEIRGGGEIVLTCESAGGEFVSMTMLADADEDLGGQPVPPNSIHSHSCSFAGGNEAGVNPKVFCGPCAWSGDPSAPSQCGGNPAGQQFVRNGTCTSNWIPSVATCCWSSVTVNADTYILSAGANPCNCSYSVTFFGVFSLSPSMICCSWTKNPAVPPGPTTYNRCLTKPGCS